MKIFVTILVASTLALANADISLKSGYNYNGNNLGPQSYYMPQQQQQQIPPPQQQPQYPTQNIIPQSFLKPNTQYLPQPQLQHQNQPQLQLQQNQRYPAPQKPQQQFNMQFPMPSDFPSSFSFQPAVNTKPQRRYRPRVRTPKKPIVTKNFFIHSAPEETQAEIEEELAALQQQPRKHYNVLFVKTPSQTNKAAALNLAKAIKEEKTVVYVLAKKTSAADLQDAIKDAPQTINKPEVFFIKYRTPEEAANAQRQIQSQYDSLGGSTTITDEGVAPATSVIGSLDASEEEEEEEGVQQTQLDNSQEQQIQNAHYDEQQLVNALQSSNNNGYLPPSNQY
ncbi:mediator of RNA polymerase II transcription subunit 15 [Lucilia cuprina]|uniref:mediator of RNA polymerase II transcription subunit 15 n=1 Tax=Lucilia cuprina TaxID=7375 RepID=UPI001F05D3F5|nr:mediator of RNA polymerase II transcription subunit 15 [Lucilia cuprina]